MISSRRLIATPLIARGVELGPVSHPRLSASPRVVLALRVEQQDLTGARPRPSHPSRVTPLCVSTCAPPRPCVTFLLTQPSLRVCCRGPRRPCSVPALCPSGPLAMGSSAFTSDASPSVSAVPGFAACTGTVCRLFLSARKLSQHCAPRRVSDGRSQSPSLLLCARHALWPLPCGSLCPQW